MLGVLYSMCYEEGENVSLRGTVARAAEMAKVKQLRRTVSLPRSNDVGSVSDVLFSVNARMHAAQLVLEEQQGDQECD